MGHPKIVHTVSYCSTVPSIVRRPPVTGPNGGKKEDQGHESRSRFSVKGCVTAARLKKKQDHFTSGK